MPNDSVSRMSPKNCSPSDHSDTEPEMHAPVEDAEGPLSWELRVMLVCAVWLMPGALCALLVRMFIPDSGQVELWLTGGAMLAATVGGLIEADHLF